jgi:nitrate reductase (NAD(P)H)
MWIKALLSKKTVISSDTRIFKFNLEHPQQTLGLPTGQHVFLRLRDPVTNESIIRPYTPYSSCTQLGSLDVLVKVYFDTAARPGGKMTKALEALAVAETVEFKGPVGKFEYLGRGRCAIGPQTRQVRRFVMICGGSGVTPIFQVLRAVMQDRGDGTRCVVLDGNRTEEDILCREEIDGLTEGREEQCRVVHTLSKPGEKWERGKGRIGRRLLEEEVGRFGQTGYAEGEELVLICGPEPLEKEVKEILNGLGWGNEYLLFF